MSLKKQIENLAQPPLDKHTYLNLENGNTDASPLDKNNLENQENSFNPNINKLEPDQDSEIINPDNKEELT